MSQVASEIIFNVLKAHFKQEPEGKIIELTAKVQSHKLPVLAGKAKPDLPGNAYRYNDQAELFGFVLSE